MKGMTDIVDELIKEGISVNRETALDLIYRFNRKSADLVLSGYNVNNGLVNLRSSVRGPLNDGKWNPAVNWVDVTITHGKDMYEAVAKTTVELLGEKDEPLESYNLSNQKNQFIESPQNSQRAVNTNTPTLKIAGEPACGMAFRQWLCRA
jgi:3',5'-cyclic AMP phosphodiesterase CpdA